VARRHAGGIVIVDIGDFIACHSRTTDHVTDGGAVPGAHTRAKAPSKQGSYTMIAP